MVALQHDAIETLLISFFDSLRAHLSSRVREKLANSRIAVMALQAHTSDCLQLLDVLVFGPIKHRTNKSVHEKLKSFGGVSRSGLRFGRLDIWRYVQSG